jgi:hypothetical protein
MIFMLISITFVTSWPTIAGSMTGYVPVTQPFIADKNENLFRFSELKLLYYVIHDGQRVGLTPNYFLYEGREGT